MLSRRGALAIGLTAATAGCGGADGRATASRPTAAATEDDVTDGASLVPERISYGDDPSQYAELWRHPERESLGTVVVIHGGFWKALYDAALGQPLARSLADAGWTAWNLEYRRVGNGGGVPETLDDVAAGLDALADVPGLNLTRVVMLGHSAGGHLATWAGAMHRFPRWAGTRVRPTAVISQAGVVNLDAAYDDNLGDGAVQAFVGAPPAPAYAEVDPARQLPLEVPVWCVHGRSDDVVPFSQSENYVIAARQAGAAAELVGVDGDHFVVVDPASDAWRQTLSILGSLA